MFAKTKDYLLMMNSKSRRYLAPVTNSEYREIDFMQGIAVKFKLIGRQELNDKCPMPLHVSVMSWPTLSLVARQPKLLESRDLMVSTSKSIKAQDPGGRDHLLTAVQL